MKNIFIIIIIYYFLSCAQRVPPSGGKKDIINPKLLSSIPKNQTLNFKDNVIEIYFDEYVKVENINQNLIITPAIEGNYTTKVKPTGAKLTFDKAFKENTTYSLNFRSTFKDISENNEAKNIRLVFSTGNTIDSLKINGTVTDPLVNKPVFDALVGLYVLTDSLNIRKDKPYYFTKTDSLGLFSIENIQPNKYKIYAIVDQNNNTIFNELTEKIGYLNDTLQITKSTENLKLEIVKQDKLPLKINRTRTTVHYANVELNKGITSFKINFLNAIYSLPYMLANEKEIKIFNSENITDTVKIELQVTDSIGTKYNIPQKFLFKKPGKKADGIREELKYSIEPIATKYIENNMSYTITFNKPISIFNSKNINILSDTLVKVPLIDSNFIWNESKNILTINTKSKAKNILRLQILENTFFSIENDTLKKINQDNKIVQADDTGIISGEIKGSKGDEIIQLLNGTYDIISEVKYMKKYIFKNVLPGKYYIRMIQDSNKNGKWDAGNVEKNIYHEKIQFINSIIQVKANFEMTAYNFTIL